MLFLAPVHASGAPYCFMGHGLCMLRSHRSSRCCLSIFPLVLRHHIGIPDRWFKQLQTILLFSCPQSEVIIFRIWSCGWAKFNALVFIKFSMPVGGFVRPCVHVFRGPLLVLMYARKLVQVSVLCVLVRIHERDHNIDCIHLWETRWHIFIILIFLKQLLLVHILNRLSAAVQFRIL